MNFWSALVVIVGLMILSVIANNYLQKSEMIACVKNNTIEACNEFLNND